MIHTFLKAYFGSYFPSFPLSDYDGLSNEIVTNVNVNFVAINATQVELSGLQNLLENREKYFSKLDLFFDMEYSVENVFSSPFSSSTPAERLKELRSLSSPRFSTSTGKNKDIYIYLVKGYFQLHGVLSYEGGILCWRPGEETELLFPIITILEKVLNIDINNAEDTMITNIKLYKSETIRIFYELQRLVNSMRHMTFRKEMSLEIESILSDLQKVDKVENISHRLKTVQNIFSHAQYIFYDMSLLPQMFFEYQQLAAVICPLILPISIPIIRNIVQVKA
eukprot:snap_masked-scaffold_34-processed-gene-0.38-mRNA-1 protein AED:1.00 eAED:1.00 QI:0/0/0/0/1/1/2/0/279